MQNIVQKTTSTWHTAMLKIIYVLLSGSLTLYWIKIYSFQPPCCQDPLITMTAGSLAIQKSEAIKCKELTAQLLRQVIHQCELSTRYLHDTFITQIQSDFYQSWLSWENSSICRVSQGITTLSYLNINLSHATEGGIRILPYRLFMAPACFIYFDSNEYRTWP